jgi:hypothetical protein
VLKDAVKKQVTVVFPSTLTFQVAVQDLTYLVVDVQATVLSRAGVEDLVRVRHAQRGSAARRSAGLAPCRGCPAVSPRCARGSCMTVC